MSRTPDPIKDWLESIKGRVCYPDAMKVYAPTCHGKCNDAVEELTLKITRSLVEARYTRLRDLGVQTLH